MRNLEEDSSGSGDVAYRLAESTGLNLPMKWPVYSANNAFIFNNKRNKISSPKKPTTSSKKHINPMKKAEKAEGVKKVSVEQKKKQPTKKVSVQPNQVISTREVSFTRNSIKPEVRKLTMEEYHINPVIGMHLRCNIPRKNVPLNGTLEFLGHIPNLPKRSDKKIILQLYERG